MKSLLRTSDLSPTDLTSLLDRADALKREPQRGVTMLRGETVVLYFEKPSTRTRLSIETAVARLGGNPIFTSAADLQIVRGESIEDTARVGSRFAKAWVLRTFKHETVEHFAAAATVPVVNALTNDHHPCQSLADLMTIRERRGALPGRRVAWVGPGNNVSHSFLEACALAGMHLRLASPPQFGPSRDVVELGRSIAAETGGSIELFDDAREAVKGAEVVYTDVWSSMGDDPRESAARGAAFAPYRVDAALMSRAAEGAIFLHCMPFRRGEEVTADVVDGPRSAVLDQAENRLHTSVALLEMLFRLELRGRKR